MRKNKPQRRWTEEEIEFCKNNCHKYSYKEMAKVLTRKFKKPTTWEHVKCLYARKHLGNGRDCRFEKGMVAHNKGKTWDEYMPKEAQEKAKKGQFKKGNIAYNWTPIGTISVRTDTRGRQYNFIKIKDKQGFENFMLNSRYVYEKEHNVKLKKDEHILHLDGNSLNDDIDNLMVVSLSEKGILNMYYDDIEDIELRKAVILTTRINDKIKKLKEG